MSPIYNIKLTSDWLYTHFLYMAVHTWPCRIMLLILWIADCFRGMPFNPLTAGAACIRGFFSWHIKYHVLNMLKIKSDINQQDLKRVDLHFVVDRVSETQLQVGNLAIKGLNMALQSQTTVASSNYKQVLPFGFTWQYTSAIWGRWWRLCFNFINSFLFLFPFLSVSTEVGLMWN